MSPSHVAGHFLAAGSRPLMRDHDIGPVIVVNDDGSLRGIVTDRDIVVRSVAEEQDPTTMGLAQICSDELVLVGPDDDAELAVRLMRGWAVRRVPVVENELPVGIVAIGDLAVTRDPGRPWRTSARLRRTISR